MKVFDFTDGVKGKFLANIDRCNSTGSWTAEKNGKLFKVTLAKSHGSKTDDWSWHNSATFRNFKNHTDVNILPEDFGVEAICFCKGFFLENVGIEGEEQQRWQWTVIGTNDWNRNACKKGILKAELMA